jgi:regulator of protease activity HflC (stomatin/prohibitin superfamily)
MLRVVAQPNIGIRETFGRFRSVVHPGLHFYVPFITRITEYDTRAINRSKSLQVKTRDNVFCVMGINLVTETTDVKKRHYTAKDPYETLNYKLEEVMRSAAAKYTLEELFEARETIQSVARCGITNMAINYGIDVCSVAITDIEPDSRVKKAMNEVNAATRERDAAAQRSEAKKLELIKEAEARAESKKLQGQGIADMRSAIIGGYKDRINDMAETLGITPHQAIAMTLTTQYLEGQLELAKSDNAKILFYSQDAAHTVQDVTRQFGTLFVDKVIASQ